VHIKANATTEECFILCLCSAWHQWKQTSLPLFGRGERWNRKQRDAGGGRAWQVRLHLLSNGYIVMARLLFPLVLSLTHTHTDTQISDKSLIRASCFLLNFFQSFVSLTLPLLSFCAPPLPSFRPSPLSDKGEHTSDWQSDWSSERAYN